MSGPHDLLARFTFGQPERAEAELRATLPPHVVARVDWSTLRREPNSVVDPELRETESDLLFSARFSGGRPVLFYVLLEHQSSVDRWMALRMLRYVVRQLEHWRKENSGHVLLPVIIPLVLYHGAGGAWSAPRRVEELFDVPDGRGGEERWNKLVPRFEYLLDDLTIEREESLMARPGPPVVRLVLLLLAYGRTKELEKRLPGWAALAAQVYADLHGVDDLKAVFHYLLRVADPPAQSAAVGMLRSAVGTQRAEDMMSSWLEEQMAERFLAWNRKVKVQAKAEGIAESVLRALAARGIHVDDSSRQRILSCTDLATLDRWFDRALTATRLSDVLDDLTQ
ncbi:Rpn family recombination-promoting nuclease/putative transposase [Hyalangium versicolor]|uniref:Rpn family recombination-promoting nuclease/putative transposase n=1 Tax=Hyalangium versicolor TaxID=2861190 RepID=UPI001CCADAC5|nr:Rpn family recombination-promoting nuclease/putative transposase [Hyalangium versicolor]